LRCPRCGGILVRQRFVETWDRDGEPHDVNDYLVCKMCRIVWMERDLDAMSPYVVEGE